MATIDQILAGLIEFRDTVYAQLNVIEGKITALSLDTSHICTMCHGTGEIIPSHNIENGSPEPTICPSCGGTKYIHDGKAVEST